MEFASTIKYDIHGKKFLMDIMFWFKTAAFIYKSTSACICFACNSFNTVYIRLRICIVMLFGPPTRHLCYYSGRQRHIRWRHAVEIRMRRLRMVSVCDSLWGKKRIFFPIRLTKRFLVIVSFLISLYVHTSQVSNGGVPRWSVSSLYRRQGEVLGHWTVPAPSVLRV